MYYYTDISVNGQLAFPQKTPLLNALVTQSIVKDAGGPTASVFPGRQSALSRNHASISSSQVRC